MDTSQLTKHAPDGWDCARFWRLVLSLRRFPFPSLFLPGRRERKPLGRGNRKGATMILPKDRDPRFITIRRGETLTDSDHRLLALWAAACAEHVLPSDLRPRQAIEQTRAWARGEVTMSQSRNAAGHAQAAARALSGAARHAAFAAGQAAHELGAAAAPACEGKSAVGSANSSPLRFANSSWRISGCATRSAGRCSTADGHDGWSALPNKRFYPTPRVPYAVAGSN